MGSSGDAHRVEEQSISSLTVIEVQEPLERRQPPPPSMTQGWTNGSHIPTISPSHPSQPPFPFPPAGGRSQGEKIPS